MVALGIAGFIGIGMWSLMQTENKTYALQDNTSQMQQNLRAAVDQISRDVLLAGQGPAWQMTINGATSTWYTLSAGWNFGQPYYISNAPNAIELDIIGIASIASTGNTQTTLSAAVASGATQITVAPAAQSAYFPVGTYIDVGDEGAYESAKVTGVAGSTLTIDTKPNTGKALQGSYASGTNVCPLQWITYVVNTATNQLTRDQHDGNGPQVVAYNIQNLNVQAQTAYCAGVSLPGCPVPDGGTLQITLTGLGAGPNAANVSYSATNTIHLRNL